MTHRGEMYTQIDGIAMGSPLGVLFADFYMGIVEERVFSLHPKPQAYCRYVDDTFVKADDPRTIEDLRLKFEEHSSLRFTCENSSNRKLPFLDVLLCQSDDNTIKTEVYRKPTNMGLCINGRSECPERYKRTAINAYIQRALTHCSTWKTTTEEIENATQILVNNGFTNKEIQNQTKKAVDKWYLRQNDDAPSPDAPAANTPSANAPTANAPATNASAANPPENLQVFYKNQYHRNYKQDEKSLREIINNNVKPKDNYNVKLIIYYKSKKTHNLIMKNNPSPAPETLKRRNVVYLFKCPYVECSHSYVGMTTLRLSKRISCHVQEGNIHAHFKNIHNCTPARDRYIESIEIIDSNPDCKRLRFLEALHILELKPTLNCTQEPLLLPTCNLQRPINPAH